MRYKQAIRSIILLLAAGVWLLSACQPGGAPLQGPFGAATQAQQTEQAAGAIASKEPVMDALINGSRIYP